MLICSFPGELRHISKLRYWGLEAVLHDKYLFPATEAEALASFLTPMLRLHPEKRARASELTHHRWLDGVVVQGEIDVIRRAEREEEERRRGVAVGGEGGEMGPPASLSRSGSAAGLSASSATAAAAVPPALAAAAAAPTTSAGMTAADKEKKKLSGLTQSEADAMKPVGELESAANSPSPSREGGIIVLGGGAGAGSNAGAGTHGHQTRLGAAPVPIPVPAGAGAAAGAGVKERDVPAGEAGKRRSVGL
jgi:serine/threonine-protein kinase SRPK3